MVEVWFKSVAQKETSRSIPCVAGIHFSQLLGFSGRNPAAGAAEVPEGVLLRTDQGRNTAVAGHPGQVEGIWPG